MIKKITACRICGNNRLEDILDLGVQALTGFFPKNDMPVASSPLALVKCAWSPSACGLLQLAHQQDISTLYGDHYGYRSGLNPAMVAHLATVVQQAESIAQPQPGDLILDIGSNDGTLLSHYSSSFRRVGMDPAAAKFRQFYGPDIYVLPEFFTAKSFQACFAGEKVKIVTSIAMFYDLPDPVAFARDIHDILADDGIWILEQSYMPLMLENTAYDTVCHEHLEYYGLEQILWIFRQVGFKVIDVLLNNINGGSFRIVAAKTEANIRATSDFPDALIKKEAIYHSLEPFSRFQQSVVKHRQELLDLLASLRQKGKIIFGLGASTKGNVLLQYCNLSPKEIPFIAEVNEDKFGAHTPGSHIPIISEKQARLLAPDYYLVLPWHFRTHFLSQERSFLEQGGHLIFPLPLVEVIGLPHAH